MVFDYEAVDKVTGDRTDFTSANFYDEGSTVNFGDRTLVIVKFYADEAVSAEELSCY